MSQHAWIGYKLLAPISFLEKSLDIVLYHHEHWDGTGYPKGLQGEEIPLTARIFAVVDVWDAIQSERPYKAAWTREKAINLIRDNAGTHFDPKIAKIFLEIIEKGEVAPL
jgi:HD-GYP domain-containing protein (c-di-GMP phosphodiesterase class II)